MKVASIAISTITLAILSSFSVNTYAERVIIQVDNANKGLIKALTRQQGGKFHLDSDGFIAASFDGKTLGQVKALLNSSHVKHVEVDQKRYFYSSYSDGPGHPMDVQVTPYAVVQSQADQVSTGLDELSAVVDIKVCVIDSGLDDSNLDFNWNNITGDNDSGTGNWFDHGGPHGTHVAGTVAAQDNGFGVVGMAPDASLHIIKVFNDDGWGYSSSLAAAANKCRDAGADIISMSLGGGGASSTEDSTFQSFVDNGGLVVAAAGNDGNSARSYPAGYSSVVMVGANDRHNNIASFSQHPSCTVTVGRGRNRQTKTDDTICVELTAGGVDTLSTYPAGMANLSLLSADGVGYGSAAMENSGKAIEKVPYFMGTGGAIDTNAAGKMCLIDRGDNISFYNKVKNCEDSGGVGAVIINNVSGMLYGTLGDSNDTSIPAVGIALEDRSAFVDGNDNEVPALVSLDIGASDYGFMSGTSMATPAVSGVAALVWSNFPTCSGEQIRAALKASAEDGGAAGHDVYFGYGIVKAKAAFDYLTVNDCDGTVVDPGGDISLTANGYKVKGNQMVDLTWSGTSSSDVDIFRDGNLIATVADTGSYTDNLNRKGGGSYTYQVCEAGTSTCSSEVTVTF